MSKFKITDKHIAFVNAIAGGMTASTAYIEHMAVNPKCTKRSAAVRASTILARSEMKQLLERTRKAREEAITSQVNRNLTHEFQGFVLTPDEMDSFHSAIVRGLVDVEEVVPQWQLEEVLDKDGNVVKRSKRQTFVRVKRPPNIRERQISSDILYKRFGSYAARKFFGAFKNLDGDEQEGENVERFIMLSNGDKISFPGTEKLLPNKK